jgi:uncharacterized membrane protein YoaK (UPF0700 family)
MRWSLPVVQSLTAGYADTSGFLALKGLFTSHVTGNFVTLGASLVFGMTGTLTKTLALPVFCVVVFLSRLLAFRLEAAKRPVFRNLLRLQVVLLFVAAALAVWLGPIGNPDGGAALALGMTLVCAMALQNAAHRTYLSHTPPSTIMTGTTTQVMLDLAELVHGLRAEVAASTVARFRRMSLSIVVFAGGCGLAAFFFAQFGKWCFCALPLFGLVSLMMRDEVPDAGPD